MRNYIKNSVRSNLDFEQKQTGVKTILSKAEYSLNLFLIQFYMECSNFSEPKFTILAINTFEVLQ